MLYVYDHNGTAVHELKKVKKKGIRIFFLDSLFCALLLGLEPRTL